MLVKKYILPDPILQIHFLESIRSEAWLDWLINEHILMPCLDSSNVSLSRSAGWMLEVLVQFFPQKVLQFLADVGAAQRKQLVASVLFRLSDWTYPLAIELFDVVEEDLRQHRILGLEHILKNAAQHNPRLVGNKLSNYVLAELDQKNLGANSVMRSGELIPRELGHVFDKFQKLHSDIYIEIALNLVQTLVERTTYENAKRTLFMDEAFYDVDKYDSLYEHWNLLENVRTYLLSLAKADRFHFEEVASPFLASNSATLISIVVQGWNGQPENYVPDSYNLLTRERFFLDYDVHGSSLGFEVRKLLKNVYPLYNASQKTEVNRLLLNSEPEYERYKDYRNRRGKNQYLLLLSLPGEERTQYPEIKKRFLELERKFGKYEEKAVERNQHMMSGIGPPIPTRAYQYMTFEQWLQTFKEFDDTTGWDSSRHYNNPRGFHFGGLVEHSRMFAEQIKANPDKYFPFIERLLNEDISQSYLAEALRGLTEIKYDSEKLKCLIKSLGINRQNTELRRSMIWTIRYLANVNSVDMEVISILEEFALRDPDPEEEIWIKKADGGKEYYGGDPLHYGINTVRGSAIETLVLIGQRKEFATKILQVLTNINQNCSVAVRCCAVNHLAVLIQHEREKTEEVFLQITNDLHPQVIKYSLSCLSYLMKHNFQSYRKHFEIAMTMTEGYSYDTVQHFVGEVLMLAYAEGLRGSRSLLEESFQISDDAKAGSVDFSIRHLIHSGSVVRNKARLMYKRFLSNHSEPVQNEYSRGFSQINVNDFQELFPYILAYAKGGYDKKQGHDFFLEFLQKCVHSYPEKILAILDSYFVTPPSESNQVWYFGEPVQLLVGMYDRLNKGKKNRKELEQAMNVFDRMLADVNLRGQALGVLREMDYS